MKNTRLKRIAYSVVTLVLLVIVLGLLTNFLERKDSVKKTTDFFEQKADYDVLFFGASHMYCDVYPMELWENYGIVSYNFGQSLSRMPENYWVMKNALDYTNPKVVVVDCQFVNSDLKGSDKVELLHEALDPFPMSINKAKAIADLCDDPAQEEYQKQFNIYGGDRSPIGFVWNYSTYHARWNEIEMEDFVPSISVEKGANSKIGVIKSDFKPEIISPVAASNTLGISYLDKLILECNNKGIEVVLTYLPYPTTLENQQEAAMVYELANSYGVKYINFYETDLVNYETDMFDLDSHLNPSGARKITAHLGDILSNDYGILDQRENATYVNWHDDHAKYIDFKNANLTTTEDLFTYLMLLSGDDIDVSVLMKGDSAYSIEWFNTMLENAGVTVSDDNILENTDATDDSIRITVKRNNEIIDDVEFFYTVSDEYKTLNLTSVAR